VPPIVAQRNPHDFALVSGSDVFLTAGEYEDALPLHQPKLTHRDVVHRLAENQGECLEVSIREVAFKCAPVLSSVVMLGPACRNSLTRKQRRPCRGRSRLGCR